MRTPGTLVAIGLEVAAELGRGVGLQVPGVDGAQAAVQEEEDERDILRRLAGSAARAWRQQFRQRQAEAEDAGGPQAQEIAAGDAVAEGLAVGHVPAP